MSENHELFTELSSEQAATVEGGLTLVITKVQCLKAGADGFFGGGDDVSVKLDGEQQIFYGGSFKSGDSKVPPSQLRTEFFGRDAVAVDLFDRDGGITQADFLGGFTARSTGNQVVSQRVSGSGSRYRVFYRAF